MISCFVFAGEYVFNMTEMVAKTGKSAVQGWAIFSLNYRMNIVNARDIQIAISQELLVVSSHSKT